MRKWKATVPRIQVVSFCVVALLQVFPSPTLERLQPRGTRRDQHHTESLLGSAPAMPAVNSTAVLMAQALSIGSRGCYVYGAALLVGNHKLNILCQKYLELKTPPPQTIVPHNNNEDDDDSNSKLTVN